MKHVFAGSLCAGLMACATHEAPRPIPPYTPPPSVRLSQQGYGGEAHFAYCQPESCPQVTPKRRPGAPLSNDAINADAPTSAPLVEPIPQPIQVDSATADPRDTHAAVVFAPNHSTLDRDARHRLEALLSVQRAAPHLTIIGYTDSTGPQHVNDDIAIARANAAAGYLAALPSEEMTVLGRGRYCCITSNRDAEGRARNRRVEVDVGALPARVL